MLNENNKEGKGVVTDTPHWEHVFFGQQGDGRASAAEALKEASASIRFSLAAWAAG